jgi:hypothetical protein
MLAKRWRWYSASIAITVVEDWPTHVHYFALGWVEQFLKYRVVFHLRICANLFEGCDRRMWYIMRGKPHKPVRTRLMPKDFLQLGC